MTELWKDETQRIEAHCSLLPPKFLNSGQYLELVGLTGPAYYTAAAIALAQNSQLQSSSATLQTIFRQGYPLAYSVLCGVCFPVPERSRVGSALHNGTKGPPLEP